MASITVEGNNQLVGEIHISGAKNAALKIIYASLFSNEDVVLENVPRITSVLADLVLIESVGGLVEWVGTNTLRINGSGMNTSEVPYEVGAKTKTALLLAGPLLYRFGKAKIPRYNSQGYSPSTVDYTKYFNTWERLGISITENEEYIELDAKDIHFANISFKHLSHTGTDSAILSALFLEGETVLTHVSEAVEVDSLIEFCILLGGDVTRTEPRKIVVKGTNIFKGAKYKIVPDKTEAAAFAALAVLTNGNLILRNVDRAAMIPFVNLLTKLGVRFEFIDGGLKVWHDGTPLSPVDTTIAPTPGLIPDWKALITLMLTKAVGESIVHDTVYTSRTEYVTDFNRMGAGIELLTPSSAGISPIISDSRYDIDASGEPKTILKIVGEKKLRGEKLNIASPVYGSDGASLVLASLSAEGKSYISGIENLGYYYENFIEKLRSIGAKIDINEHTT
jgi:UDP-N-acetylglucosamine 1-carboxyvinyltransferase